MYRGSRIAATLLLVLTGSIVVALGALVPSGDDAGSRALATAAIAAGIVHLVAAVGVARNRAWAGRLGLLIAEIAGGLALVGIVAAVLGTDVLRAGTTTIGFLAWIAFLYALVGLSVGRVPGFTAPVLPRPGLPLMPDRAAA